MIDTVTERSIDPLLFDWPQSVSGLKCSVCNQCAARAFPAADNCMRCGSDDVAVAALPSEGTLWTYTIQHFMPKEPYSSEETPETFRPFGIGYIDLGGGLKIETRIPAECVDQLKIGMDMRLSFYRHNIDADGTRVISYEFKPVVETV